MPWYIWTLVIVALSGGWITREVILNRRAGDAGEDYDNARKRNEGLEEENKLLGSMNDELRREIVGLDRRNEELSKRCLQGEETVTELATAVHVSMRGFELLKEDYQARLAEQEKKHQLALRASPLFDQLAIEASTVEG